MAQGIRQLVLPGERENGNSNWVKPVYTHISVGWWWLNNCFTLQYVLSYSKMSLCTTFLIPICVTKTPQGIP